MLQFYTEKYSVIWETSPTLLPEFSRSYTKSEKKQKEKTLDVFLQSIKLYRRERKRTMTEAELQQFLKRTRMFLRDGFDFTNDQLEIMFSDDLIETTKSFVRKARSFDPDLSFSDIFQACRNALIMHGLQIIMGLKIQLTPSIFAYSMLYPYTDNMIDDPTISNYDKVIFSERFRIRLSGKNIQASNKTENAIFKLVEMIENQYSRTDFPEVFESLLNIHHAQTASLKLIRSSDSLSENETLKICIEKGGASVLADGFLVAGKLTEAQKYFLYGYGAYLQLLDDIQDINDDYQAGLMTVFSRSANQSPLDEKLNKTYWFGEQVMQSLQHFEGQQLDVFQSLMRKSMDLFIIEAIAQNPHTFSHQYVSDFERYSPLNFSYIRKRKDQYSTYNSFLISAFEEFAFTENLVLG